MVPKLRVDLKTADLDDARVRARLYASLTVLLFLASITLATTWAILHHDSINWILSDGRYYWCYLPTVVIDHDLDIENQVREHFPERVHQGILSVRTPRGYAALKYPIGEALTLAPAFLVAHGLAGFLHPLTGWTWLKPDGYSFVYQILGLAWILTLGGLSMILLDRWLTRILGPPGAAILAAVLLWWLGTPYFWYFLFEPFMVHVLSTFWIAVIVYLSGRAIRQARRGHARWWLPGAIGLAVTMALICRPTDLVILPVAVAGLWPWLRSADGRTRWRALPALVPAAAPILIQMAVWRIMSGSFFYYSYGNEPFYFTRPALWQTLISTRHGLFLWSPLLLVGVWGLARRGSRWPQSDRPFLVALLIGGVALWYLNSAWHCWWFGWAFGGRAFTELAPLFLAGFALALQPYGPDPARSRRRLTLVVAALLCFHFALVVLFALQIIPPNGDFFHSLPE